MAEDLKLHGVEDALASFVSEWSVIPDCPIAEWCLKRGEGSIGDHLPAFVRMSSRNPQVARIAHYHISHLMDSVMCQTMVDVVSKDPVQSARMWLEDSTITEDQASLLYNVFMNEKSGAGSYREALLAGNISCPERGLAMNKLSILGEDYGN